MVALNDSAMALSKQIPVCLTDGMIPFANAKSRKSRLVYWLPRSEWMTTSPMPGRCWSIAIANASGDQAPAGHIKRRTHQGNRNSFFAWLASFFFIQITDEGELHMLWLANHAAAFFKIS